MAFDYKKEYKEFYMPKSKPSIVTVPEVNYIAVRGQGDPNPEDSDYKKAINLLYQRLFNALVSISPVPVRFEEIEGGAKGYYHDGEKRIAIQSGMSQAQTIKTLLHEVSHATYHSREAAGPDHPIDRRHKETEAESIAFCVGSALSIVDSGDYTFPYLASWASGKDTKELKDSLERIRSASDEMITAIDQSLQKQANREKQKSRDEGR